MVKMTWPVRFQGFSDRPTGSLGSVSLCRYVAVTTDFVSRICRHVVWGHVRMEALSNDSARTM